MRRDLDDLAGEFPWKENYMSVTQDDERSISGLFLPAITVFYNSAVRIWLF